MVTCPNLKHLDLRKVTPDMRDIGGLKGTDGKLKAMIVTKRVTMAI